MKRKNPAAKPGATRECHSLLKHAAKTDCVVFSRPISGAAKRAGELLGGVFPTAAAEDALRWRRRPQSRQFRPPARQCSRRARCRRTIPKGSRARRRAARRWASARQRRDRCPPRFACSRRGRRAGPRRRQTSTAWSCQPGRRTPIRLRWAGGRLADRDQFAARACKWTVTAGRTHRLRPR